jgi:hypothetical protein
VPARRFTWLILLVIFVAALVPRAHHAVSRTQVWYRRSDAFIEAVRKGDWGGTYLRYHPGVTTMWVAGLSMATYDRATLTRFRPQIEAVARPLLDLPIEVRNGTRIGVGVAGLAVVISLGIAAVTWLLKKIANWPTAIAGGLFLAWDPAVLSNSKVLHVDALMSTLMLLSALLVLRYLQSPPKRWLYLVASGAAGGLALLTKSPALFLVPYVGLGLALSGAGQAWHLLRSRRFALLARLAWRDGLRPALIWLAAAGLVFWAMWPAMWVTPLRAVEGMLGGILLNTQHADATPAPLYFMGQTVAIEADPGWPFVAVDILTSTTPVTLALSLAALFIFIAWRRDKTVRANALSLWMMAAFAFFFFVEMSLAAEKQPRYALPSNLGIDVMAAFGLVGLTARLERLAGRKVVAGLVGLAVALQALITLPAHPHYGTVFNATLGGPRVAAGALPIMWWGDGLDVMADRLNAEAPDVLVYVNRRSASLFRQRFVGQTTTTEPERANLLVFDLNSVLRGASDPEIWRDAWEEARYREPEQVVAFGGETYVWLYARPPDPSDPDALRHPLDVQFGDGLELLGYEFGNSQLAPGESLRMTLYWQHADELAPPPTIEAALFDREGQPVGGWTQAIRPLNGSPGEAIAARYQVALPTEVGPGQYRLSVRPTSGGEDYAMLGELTLRRPGVPAGTLVAWAGTAGLAGLIAWASRHGKRHAVP